METILGSILSDGFILIILFYNRNCLAPIRTNNVLADHFNVSGSIKDLYLCVHSLAFNSLR